MSDNQELPAGVGVVFPFGDENAWRARLKVIYATTSIKPAMRRHDDQVDRAIYAPAKVRTIINLSSAKVLERLGYPMAVMTLEVESAMVAAEVAVQVLGELHFKAEIVDAVDVELGIPSGFMYFVLVPGQVPLLFWPKRPDPAVLSQLTPLEPWTNEL